MVTKEQVLEALKHINDPTYNRSLIELHLIRDIVIKENRVNVTIVLTKPDDDSKLRCRQEVESGLRSLGVHEPHIRFRTLTELEKADLEKGISDRTVTDQMIPDLPQTRTQAQLNAAGVPGILLPEAGVRFIAIASGKGGVGKSTVTVNLAAALARKGKRVGIIDADIYGFSVPEMMGIEERPKLLDNRIIPVERFGVKVISMGFFVEENAPIIWRGPMLGKMLRTFFHEVDWGEIEYLLLDLPPGTGDVALDVHQLIPQSKEIIVTTPHPTAAFVAARAGAMAIDTDHEIIGVIENMSYYVDKNGEKAFIFGRGGGDKLADELHTELLAQIPLGAPDNDPADSDYSPSVYKSGTAAGNIYDGLAQKIIGN